MTRLVAGLVLLIVLLGCDPFEKDQGGNIPGCPQEGCSVSGYVYDEDGNPLRDVRIERSGSGAGYVKTDKNGHYALYGNVLWWRYCFTPSKPRYAFEPENRCYKKIDACYTDQNFVAALVESFDISGYIIDQHALPVQDVLVDLEGGAGGRVRTNTQGYYLFVDVVNRQDYCMIPTKDGCTFEPTQICIENLSGDSHSQNFFATCE
jgi:hypothetical protein